MILPRSSWIAVGCAILIHLVLVLAIDFFWAPPAPPSQKMIPVTYVGIPEKKEPEPVPDEPDMLAEINRRAMADLAGEEARMATDPEANPIPAPEAEPLPEPLTDPLPERLPAPLPEAPRQPLSAEPRAVPSIPQPAPLRNRDRATPEQEQRANLRAAAKAQPVQRTKPAPEPAEEGRNQPQEPAITPPLMLSPSLDSLTRWDNVRREQRVMKRIREGRAGPSTRKMREARYIATVKNKTLQNWVSPPKVKRRDLVGRAVSLATTIAADGGLLRVRVLRSSGNPIFDEWTIRAVKKAAPFQPLPRAWRLDEFSLTLTFEYVPRGLR